MTALQSNFLVPNGTFVVWAVVAMPIFVLLELAPLVGAIRRQQWGWVVGIVLLGPIVGIIWLVLGRTAGTRRLAAG